MFVSRNSFFRKPLFKLSCVCLILEKLVNRKFRWKTLSGSCEKFRNVILFADYIKFDPQTFDSYIYFVLNIYFSISSLKINFYINFGPHFYNCYLLFPYHFFIEIFCLSNLVLIHLIVTYFFKIIYEILIIIILISSSFIFLFFRFDLYYFNYYLFYLR